jgi:succinate dehydrogenase/fumarate reductase flavoprotein subunit
LTRYLIDRLRYPRGTRLMMGNALVARLFYSLRKRGVDILFNASIAAVDEQNGRVTGAAIKTKGGEIHVAARKGVVLATGGYGHNKRYRDAFMARPVPAHSMASEFNVGDGIAIGEQLGARIAPQEHRRSGLWTPVSLTARADGTAGLYPHLLLDRAKPGLIAVNKNGDRFVNEAVSYHDFVEGMFDANESSPSIPCYLICDETFIRKYGLGDFIPAPETCGVC